MRSGSREREETTRLLDWQRDDNREDDPVISIHLAMRLAAALYILGGLLTVMMGNLGNLPESNPRGIVMVGLSAVCIGSAAWFLPWGCWSRSWTATIVFPGFVLVMLDNLFAANEPFRYGLFFVVIFLWIGLMYSWSGLMLATPPFLIAYLVPLVIANQLSVISVTGMGFVFAISFVVGGTVAWVTRRLQLAHAELRQREERFRQLLRHASDIIAILDRDGTIRYMGASIERTMGYQPEGLVGTDVLQHVHPEDVDRITAAVAVSNQTSGPSIPIPARYRRADGVWRQLEVVVTNRLEDSTIHGVILNAHDVTERAEVQKQLAWQARHDPLTGLENRAAFAARAETALRQHVPTETVGILFIDLDNFKHVNDRLGHAAGDELLRAVAGRLRATLRPADVLARQGGDEFTVLLAGKHLDVESTLVADRLLAVLASPFAINGLEVESGASIGIALANKDNTEVDALLEQADTALYEAKRQGKGRIVRFAPCMCADLNPPERLAGPSAGSLPNQGTPSVSQPDEGEEIGSMPVPRIGPLPAT